MLYIYKMQNNLNKFLHLNKIDWSSVYKISLVEVLVLFTLLFFTYTMPLTVNKFSQSFVGKLLMLLSIGLVAHYKIIYGVVLAVLFIFISEIGYMESFSNKEGMEDGKIQESKTAFIKDHCGTKRSTFDLETIQQDYTGLLFTDGVCDPCDPTCRFNIDDTSDSLYNYNKIIKPVDVQQ
jgi:hypothetical protein